MAGLLGVPWFIGGGAQHSPQVARLLAYATSSGAEGVVNPDDLKVRPLDVPGTDVRIDPGAALILNRYIGGARQTYAVMNEGGSAPEDELRVPITATGSSGGRQDLIVLRVKDPQYPSQPAPPSVENGPYVFAEAITANASAIASPAGARAFIKSKNYPAIALAGLDIPASTGTITAAMIRDLREVALPRTERIQRYTYSTGGPSLSVLNGLSASSYTQWPSAATWTVDVPEWATRALIRVDVVQYLLKTGSSNGVIRAGLGSTYIDPSSYDENWTGNPHRGSLTMAGEIVLPSSYRGTTQTMRVQGRRTSGAGVLDADVYTTTLADIEFRERAA